MIMEEAGLALLERWHNYYAIVGSAAAGLTGLQFVVIVLLAQLQAAGSMLVIRAFGTPTVVHFCAALLLAAIVSAPWPVLHSVALGVGACGVAGVVYTIRVIRHARRQTRYAPDAEDWVWYAVLPFLSYMTLVGAAILLRRHTAASLFAIAAVSLVLVFIGIHNAWDTVTYVVVQRWQKAERERADHH